LHFWQKTPTFYSFFVRKQENSIFAKQPNFDAKLFKAMLSNAAAAMI